LEALTSKHKTWVVLVAVLSPIYVSSLVTFLANGDDHAHSISTMCVGHRVYCIEWVCHF